MQGKPSAPRVSLLLLWTFQMQSEVFSFFVFLFSLFFIFSFSCKDSHEKFTWQASRLSTSGASFSGSRVRILYKSAHAKVLFTLRFLFSYKDSHQKSSWQYSCLHIASSQILILVQGFSSKVELTVFMLTHCFIANSHSNTRILIKSRVEGITLFTSLQQEFLFSLEDSHQKSSWGYCLSYTAAARILILA